MTATRPACLGRYVIEAELGRGSMGIVYRARDPRIDRVVALKTLSPGRVDPEAEESIKERFLNEGRAAGRLSHPAIVHVYDADADAATGIAYLAMELIEGTDLKQLLREGLPLSRTIAILDEVAQALDHAHRRGVVHRDVKPANILVDSEGHAHLTDFGIARLGDSTLTQDGEFVGTPAYMAPEQLRSKPVSPQTDVYALGLVYYEALSGQRPFSGDSMVATATSIAMDEPPPPSTLAPLPGGLDEPILRALSKKPENRQATAGELAAQVRSVMDASTVVTPAPRVPAATAPRGRGRTIAFVALAAAAVIMSFVIFSRWGAPEDEAPAGSAGSSTAATGTTAATSSTLPGASRAAPPEQGDRQQSPPRTTAASSPSEDAAASSPRPARGSSLQVELISPRRGTLTVTEGGREIGRIEAGPQRKGMQYASSGRLRVAAGERQFSFTFTPLEGRPVSETISMNAEPGGSQRIVVDVGTLGRALQVKLR